MTKHATPPRGAEAPIWQAPRTEPAVAQDVLEQWQTATARLRAVAQAEGLSRTEVSKRSDVPLGTLSPWYEGTYAGRIDSVTERVLRWLDAHAEQQEARTHIPVSPEFVATPTARRLHEALMHAQAVPEIAVVTMGAGCGKTTAVRHYAAARPHVWVATMRPTTAGRHTMLQEIGWVLNIEERNATRLDREIGARIRRRSGRNTLLVLDEAQNLSDDAVNQLRYFHDEFGCGIALVGNEAVHRRWGARDKGDKPRDGLTQILSRVGFRISQTKPAVGDVEAILDAWGIADAAIRREAWAVARRDGALRVLDKVLRFAVMRATQAGEGMSITHFRHAMADREHVELGQ